MFPLFCWFQPDICVGCSLSLSLTHTHTQSLSLTDKCNCSILFYVISKLGHVVYFMHCHLKYKQYCTRGKRKTDFQKNERESSGAVTQRIETTQINATTRLRDRSSILVMCFLSHSRSPFFLLLFISFSFHWLRSDWKPRGCLWTHVLTPQWTTCRHAGEHSADLNHKNTQTHTCAALNRSPTVPPFFGNWTEFRPLLLEINKRFSQQPSAEFSLHQLVEWSLNKLLGATFRSSYWSIGTLRISRFSNEQCSHWTHFSIRFKIRIPDNSFRRLQTDSFFYRQ